MKNEILCNLEDFEKVVEVLKKKKKGKMEKLIDFVTGGLVSTANSIKNSSEQYFIGFNNNNAYLLIKKGNVISKTRISELTSIDNFRQIEISGFIYKKYKIIK